MRVTAEFLISDASVRPAQSDAGGAGNGEWCRQYPPYCGKFARNSGWKPLLRSRLTAVTTTAAVALFLRVRRMAMCFTW